MTPHAHGMPMATRRSALRRIGIMLLVPFIVLVNAAFLVVHAIVGGAARAVAAAAALLRRSGVSPAAAIVEWTARVDARARDDRAAAGALIASAAARGSGGPHPPRQWLSRTLLDGTARLLRWPFAAVRDLGAAVIFTQPTRRWSAAAGTLVSRCVDRACAPGILPGAVADLVVARTRFGFFVMLASGSRAVLLNFLGIFGGCVALLFGDPDWLANGMEAMRGYAEYVDEKERHGELGPRARMPFSRAMVGDAAMIVATYPADVVEVMRTRGFAEGLRGYWRDRARVHRMLALYLPFTFHTLDVVGRFFTRGLFDASDAPRLTLCELAVMTSALPDDRKDAALLDVQSTAPASIIEFEHYVGLVVPWDGTPAEKACRSSASGAAHDTHAVAPSIFDRHAVHVAQSTNAEACALRTFLWLYRDEAQARAADARETARKFGPGVAARLASQPLYPLERWEIEALTEGGPRPPKEVDVILLDALRHRGLEQVADAIAAVEV